MLCYLNGEYIQHAEARVSVDDRGFLFGDGVYEVVRVYDGRPLLMDRHLERMRYGLDELRIEFNALEEIEAVCERLVDENQLRSGDATLYFQVTRGAAPRAHAFPPAGTPPTVYAIAKPFQNYPQTHWSEGVFAVTVPDIRWTRCDIKSISLLGNVMANQFAKENGAFEALYHRDGMITEGSHANVWFVVEGEALTYPQSGYILGGITRQLLFERAAEAGVKVREGVVQLGDMSKVEEVFLSGTTTEIMPIVKVDDTLIGDGRPGAVTRKLQAAFDEWKAGR